MFFHTLPFQLPPTGHPWDASRATPMMSSSVHWPDLCCPTRPPADLHPQHMLPLLAAQVGGWLEQVLPPRLNAAMMPMGWPSPHGWPVPARAMAPMPAVLQGALPVLGQGMNAAHVIGALQGLCERNVTDVVVAHGGGRALPPLLAMLDRPGAVCRCELPSPGGWVTGSVARHPLPQEDGHWLMEIELSQAGRRMQSQWIRVHEARADPRSPENFHGDMARVFEGFTQRLERGEHAQMSTFCEDGATRSGAAIALMHAMGRQRELDAVARDVRDVRDVGAPMPTSHDRALDQARFLEAARTHRGPAFAQGQEGLINAAAGRMKSPPAHAESPLLDAPVPAEVLAALPEPMKPGAARPAVSEAQVPARQPAPLDPIVVAPVAPRKRAAPPSPDAPDAKRLVISAHAQKQIWAERRAIQERQVDRSARAPKTPLPDVDGGAKSGRTRQEAADLERALALARKHAMPATPTTPATPAMQDASRAPSIPDKPSIADPADVDESSVVLSLLSQGELPETEGLDPTAAPNAPGALRRAASEPTLAGTASSETPEPQRTAASLRHAVSDSELRSRPPALDRTIAVLDQRMRTLFDALVAAPPGAGERFLAKFRRAERVDVEQQVELQLRPLVEQLRTGYRKTYGGTGGREEEAFIAQTLQEAAVKAAGRYDPQALGGMASRLDASGGAFQHAHAHADKQRKLSLDLAMDRRSMPRQMRQRLLDESGLLTYVLSGIRNAVELGAATDA